MAAPLNDISRATIGVFAWVLAGADTWEGACTLMEDALTLYLEMLRDSGDPIPASHARAEKIKVGG